MHRKEAPPGVLSIEDEALVRDFTARLIVAEEYDVT